MVRILSRCRSAWLSRSFSHRDRGRAAHRRHLPLGQPEGFSTSKRARNAQFSWFPMAFRNQVDVVFAFREYFGEQKLTDFET
jgi:hypothetical protein